MHLIETKLEEPQRTFIDLIDFGRTEEVDLLGDSVGNFLPRPTWPDVDLVAVDQMSSLLILGEAGTSS